MVLKIFFFVFIAITLVGCNNYNDKPIVVTNSNYIIDLDTNLHKLVITTSGKVVASSNDKMFFKGMCWSKNSNPTPSQAPFILCNENTFVLKMDSKFQDNHNLHFDFDFNTTYYFRAFATNQNGTSYGEVIKVNTPIEEKYYLGKKCLGGTVGYIYQPGDKGYIIGEYHGLIYGDVYNNENNYLGWLYPNVQTEESIGSGLNNTYNFYKYYPNSDNIATYCYNLNLNGFDDWFLPSKDELFKIMNFYSIHTPGSTYMTFFSSSLHNNEDPWRYDKKNKMFYLDNLSSSYNDNVILPVRYF